MTDKKNSKSRRNFLKTGITAGASALAGLTGGSLLAGKVSAKTKGAKIKALTTDGRLIEVEEDLADEPAPHHAIGRKESMEGLPNRKFIMVVDLARCKNARACVNACQAGHYLPKEHEWMKLYYLKDSPQTAPYWFPRPCFHCDNPMCVSVCPVGATYKRSDGIVLVDNERCIGCKFCMTGCPYSARQFHWKEPEGQPDVEYSPETNVPAREGTVGKCVWCADLLRKGELPRCVQACPMGVLFFGDILEDTVTNGIETVRLSEFLEEKAGYRYKEELGTQPSVFYLPPANRSSSVESGFEGQDEEILQRYEKSIQKYNSEK